MIMALCARVRAPQQQQQQDHARCAGISQAKQANECFTLKQKSFSDETRTMVEITQWIEWTTHRTLDRQRLIWVGERKKVFKSDQFSLFDLIWFDFNSQSINQSVNVCAVNNRVNYLLSLQVTCPATLSVFSRRLFCWIKRFGLFLYCSLLQFVASHSGDTTNTER